MNIQEKKILPPIFKTYNNDLSKRWRVEWEEFVGNCGLKKRVVKYGNINRGKTFTERQYYANQIIEEVLKSLPSEGN